MSYEEFFRVCTGHTPYPYQSRLGRESLPDLIDVPTGMGKTAAVVVAWLWRLLGEVEGEPGPRRLVYTLPMRALVRQTAAASEGWVAAARWVFAERGRLCPTVHMLMGGDLDEEWQAFPERPALLVGTQDMLLSRALNRGFAMSRFRWPIHFGLLNNDALWVLDEVQLMGVAVETSAQLQAFRGCFGTLATTRTLWMSATVGSEELETIDHPRPAAGWRRLTLAAEERSLERMRCRLEARKELRSLPIRIRKENDAEALSGLADAVAAAHVGDSLTLVVVNRVERAQGLFLELKRRLRERPEVNLGLVHSRFRPIDRARREKLLHGAGDRIVVATQTVEAGLDISARTLITELAPWPSLVQRAGRCNRSGEYADARVLWVDMDTDERKVCLPYGAQELCRARELLLGVHECSPAVLAGIPCRPLRVVRPVIRRKDLLELFDTTPDLSGDLLDVSRWVRDGEDRDVSVVWREVSAEAGRAVPPAAVMPRREELCRVSVGAFGRFLKKAHRKRKDNPRATIFAWDHLDGRWVVADRAVPGHLYCVGREAGGYSGELGWTGRDLLKRGAEVPACASAEDRAWAPATVEEMGADPLSRGARRWVPLPEHLEAVRDQAMQLAANLRLPTDLRRALLSAARWHDVGKAHPEFQRRLQPPGCGEPPSGNSDRVSIWAKSPHRGVARGERNYFRHELASALAWLQQGAPDADGAERDLAAFLIASHHGKVRMSIRALPGETLPKGGGRFARGVWDGDELLPFTLDDGRSYESVRLDLGLMEMGRGSWLSRMLALRDAPNLGPFRLAFLEAVLRVSDWRGSRSDVPEDADA
jgi:CRISPR-associated endonuclease/helicase Cas3